MESTQAPIFQLSEEVPGTDAAGEVELPLAVDAEDILEHPGRPVKEKLTVGQRVGVANGDDFIYICTFSRYFSILFLLPSVTANRKL